MLRRLLLRLWRSRVALVVIVVLLISVLCGQWFSSRLKFDPNDTRYLLSAQAQSLSAILALVFTLTIVVAQARSSYGTRSWFRSFKPWGGAFAVLESVGILAPLYLLGRDRATQALWVPWSLALCVLCIGVITPYFIQLSESLSVKAMLNELLPVPPRARNTKEYQAITDGLMQLTGLIANSLDRHDYVLSRAAIQHLCDATLDSLTATKGGLRDHFVDALASVASCLERDAVGVNQMARSITHVGEAAVALEPQAASTAGPSLASSMSSQGRPSKQGL